MTKQQLNDELAQGGSISVILIGAGKAGEYHAECLTSMPGVQIAGVMNSGREDPFAFRERFRIPRWIKDDGELHASIADADAVVVCVTNDQAEEVFGRAAQTGLPILIEKPLGTSLESSLRMEAIQKSGAVPTVVGFNRRCYSSVLGLERLFRERGLPNRIHADAPEPLVRLMTRGRAAHHHERRLLLNTTHVLDLFTRYFGAHEEVEIANARRRKSGVVFDTMAFVYYPNNQVALFTSHSASPGPWLVSMYGESYKVDLNLTTNTAVVWLGGRETTEILPDAVDTEFKSGVWIQDALFLLENVGSRPSSGLLCTVQDAVEANRLAEVLMSK